jgi:4-azaleucine resistance transporter AzlC
MSPFSPPAQFLLGARAFLPLAVPVGAYGVIWGILAGQKGMGVAEVLAMSAFVFAGSSQFVALEMWSPGALPVGAIVMATAIVNLRMALMTATLAPLARRMPPRRAVPALWFTTDESWALTMREMREGRGSLAFLVGAGVACWIVWAVSTLFGRLAGAGLTDPARYGLDFAFTATFLALLMGMWRGRADLAPWLVAGLVAVLAARLVPGQWHILAGGLCGSLAGALVETALARRRR